MSCTSKRREVGAKLAPATGVPGEARRCPDELPPPDPADVALMSSLKGDIDREPEWDGGDDLSWWSACAEAVRQGKTLYRDISEGTVPDYPASSRRARRGLDEPERPQRKELWYNRKAEQFQVGDVTFRLNGDYVAASRDMPAEYPQWEEDGYGSVRSYTTYQAAFEDLKE